MLAFIREPCDESIIRSAPAGEPCSKSRGRWVLAATILASSMAFIDGTVVNVALPALQTTLNATAVDVQWVIEAYSLLLSALLLVGGSLGDHYGRRRVFVIGVALFASASAACGFAVNIQQLIAARALQGLGAALLIPGSLAIISNSFSEDQRGRAIGTWSGLSAITTALGPVIGGWLIEHLSWRAVFFINIPLAFLVILISLWRVPESSDPESHGLDWLGAVLAALGLGTLVYGLIESSRLGFGDRSVLAALTDGTDDFIGPNVTYRSSGAWIRTRPDRLDSVEGVVQRRSHQLGHARIDHRELADGVPGLQVDDAGDEDACGSRNRTPGFDDNRQPCRSHRVHEGRLRLSGRAGIGGNGGEGSGSSGAFALAPQSWHGPVTPVTTRSPRTFFHSYVLTCPMASVAVVFRGLYSIVTRSRPPSSTLVALLRSYV